MYNFIHISTNQINKSNITGEISRLPRLGKKCLILFKMFSIANVGTEIIIISELGITCLGLLSIIFNFPL